MPGASGHATRPRRRQCELTLRTSTLCKNSCARSRCVPAGFTAAAAAAAGSLPLLLEVFDRRLDCVLGQHRAVHLDGRKLELVRDVRVLDRAALLQSLAANPLRGERAARDRRAAAEGLEDGLAHRAVLVDADLQLHHVAARGRADDAGADVRVVLIHLAHITRVLVVLDDVLVVGARGGRHAHDWRARKREAAEAEGEHD
eukprot:CAMPEP_0179843146 /NCGR_PEP_ID=MMETSP0982-20121206/3534_1 /TAXON_ID=483367 /ORGANISM="non described non described, Strain CCMP 2436" /LENGTH=200 /DNA_ID=CAMNT_0021727525 /DNA_START=215 /DNA_END=818 /DNA_ORIENTATION=-